MSYILDALKKSEQQKQQQQNAEQTPLFMHGFEPNTVDNEKSSNAYGALVWLLGAGMLCACFLFLWLIYQQINPSNNKREDTPENILSEPIKKLNNSENRQKLKTANTPQPARKPVQANKPKSQVSVAKTPAQAKQAKTASPKLPETAPISALKRIPKLEINSHIYSPLSSKRRVTINGRDYQEGEWLSDELQLHAITQHGIRLKLGRWFIDVGRSKGWQPL